MTRTARRFFLIAAAATGAVCASCAPYTLRGKVIEGDVSFGIVTGADDARMSQPGLSNVEIELWTDPNSAGRERAGTTLTDTNGDFTIPFGEVGAGVLMYEAAIIAKRPGYATTTQILNLPGSDRRVLIILRKGAGGETGMPASLMEEYQRHR